MTDWLQIPEISESQASKYVTHNAAVRKLRVLAQVTAKDKDLSAPPGGPADGDIYIVGAGATGAWSGHDGDIAFYSTSAWIFFDPAEGWLVYLQDENIYYYYTGAAWAAFGGAAAVTFLALTDTPDNYTGDALKVVRVNAGETALEFAALPAGVATFLDLSDVPANYTDDGGKSVRVKADETGLEFFTEPYIIAAWGGDGAPTASQKMLVHKAADPFNLPADLTGSYATLETAATAQTDFDVTKNGVSIGTIRFAASGTTATFVGFSASSFSAADILRIIAPDPADATAAGFSCTLKGTRG